MEPVRIKYLGLFSTTRRGYLITLAVAALLAVTVLTVGWWLGRLPPLETLWKDPPVPQRPGIDYYIHRYLYRIILVCLILQVFDTWWVLRRFAQKERGGRAVKDERIKPA
jgi:hypothetical protein